MARFPMPGTHGSCSLDLNMMIWPQTMARHNQKGMIFCVQPVGSGLVKGSPPELPHPRVARCGQKDKILRKGAPLALGNSQALNQRKTR